jgi:O-succinylbenzoate synthase
MTKLDNKINTLFAAGNQLSLYRFSLPFKKPIQFKNNHLKSRDGLWLVKHNPKGDDFIGEVAPLLGFSQDTLEQAEQQLLTLLQGNICAQALLPSVGFALFCLTQQIPYQKSPDSLPDLESVPLLQGNAAEIKARYQTLKTPLIIKLKIARHSVTEDIQLLHSLIAMNSQVRFRLDANQLWTIEQYTAFLAQITEQHLDQYIDYIEEPTPLLAENLRISAHFNGKIGLDESLLCDSPIPLHNSIKALIIKPTLIGHPEKIEKLLTHAQQQQLSVSISSTFESPLAINQLHYLAHLWQQQFSLAITLGLDTLQVFEKKSIEISSPSTCLPTTLLNKAICLWHY